MKEVVFARQKFPHKLHTLTASLNMDADLVFGDGESYPASEPNNGREVNHHLTVRAEYKRKMLTYLSHRFDGISDTCGEVEDERLMSTLQRVAQSGHWQSLGEIETWLMDRGIPFTIQKWIDFK